MSHRLFTEYDNGQSIQYRYIVGHIYIFDLSGTLAPSAFLELYQGSELRPDGFSFFCTLQTLLAWCAHLVCLSYNDLHEFICRSTGLVLPFSWGGTRCIATLQRFRSCSDSLILLVDGCILGLIS